MKDKLIEIGLSKDDIKQLPLPYFKMEELSGGKTYNLAQFESSFFNSKSVNRKDFYKSIASFKGAERRLELLGKNESIAVYKDFAHSPSKVSATTKAVKNQYPDRKLIACLELHTYSSLNADFLKEYEGALDAADVAVVFYSPDAVKIKQLDEVSYGQISKAFNRNDLIIFTNPTEFKVFLFEQNLQYVSHIYSTKKNIKNYA